jgi:hypothetical protein
MRSDLHVLFEDFQGRKLRKNVSRDIESQLPDTVQPFGTAISVLYYADKRDPGDPHGEGAQGFWKLFIHTHDKGVIVYCDGCEEDNPGTFGPELHPDYPEASAWLGELKEMKWMDATGEQRKEEFKGMDLWVWDDRRTLMAIPKKGALKDVIIWKGGRLKVTKHGIEH